MDEESTEILRTWAREGPALIDRVVAERASLLNIAARERDTLAEELHRVQEENNVLKEKFFGIEQECVNIVSTFKDRERDLQKRLATAEKDVQDVRGKLDSQGQQFRENARKLQQRADAAEKAVMLARLEVAAERKKRLEKSKQASSELTHLKEGYEEKGAVLQEKSRALALAMNENSKLREEAAAMQEKERTLLEALQQSLQAEARAKCESSATESTLQRQVDDLKRELHEERNCAEEQKAKAYAAQDEMQLIFSRIQQLFPSQMLRSPGDVPRCIADKSNTTAVGSKADRASARTSSHVANKRHRAVAKEEPTKRPRRERKKVSYNYSCRGDGDVT